MTWLAKYVVTLLEGGANRFSFHTHDLAADEDLEDGWGCLENLGLVRAGGTDHLE